MINRFVALVISLVGIVSAVTLAVKMSKPVPAAQILTEPAKNPFMTAISASGLVEAVRENIAIGSPASGIIEEIHVDVCQEVKKGEPLFCLDKRELKAELQVKQSKVDVAQAKLIRLEDQLQRLKSVQDHRAISVNEVRTKENDVLVSACELQEAEADLHLVETRLEKMTVRAPQDGTILQKKAKVGEYLSENGRETAFIIGDLTQLQIRADVDEQNASWLNPGTPATAFPKNRPDKAIPLKFVKIEPYVIPKKSLTGLGDERVDTRVLQVIYTLEPPKDFKLYIGQQVDVFIETN